VLVAVKDQGEGIRPEDVPHVFSPFFRADRSRTRGAGGVGLGLTLAKRVVEAHGGRITLTSRLGHGTVVTLAIPVAEVEESGVTTAASPRVPPAASSDARRNDHAQQRNESSGSGDERHGRDHRVLP
jgi:hypothetical protein